MASPTQHHLPAEIQARICHYLCNHCYEPPSARFRNRNYRERRGEKKALAALSAISRRWNAVARLYLYHSLDAPSWRGREQPWDILAHTLIHNRELAHQVMTFDQEAANGQPDWNQAVRDPVELGFTDKRGADVLLLPLLLACVSRLEHLKLEVGDGYECWNNKRWQSLLFRMHSMGMYGSEAEPWPEPLSQVKTLTLMSHYEWGFSINADIVRASIQGAGPSLERLVIGNVKNSCSPEGQNSIDAIKTPKLKLLTLAGAAIESEDRTAMQLLGQLCRTSTQLDEFHYFGRSAFIGEDMNQPATAVDFLHGCLLFCHETLRVLTLGLSDWAYAIHREACLSSDVGANSLKTFVKLEELTLEDLSFCLHKHELDVEERQKIPHNCLTSLLPASIRHLVLRVYYTEPNSSGESSDRGVWEDIMELVRQAASASGPFPSLRRIDVRVTVEEDHAREWCRNPESPSEVWMAAELQDRNDALEALCRKTEVQFSIIRVEARGRTSTNSSSWW